MKESNYITTGYKQIDDLIIDNNDRFNEILEATKRRYDNAGITLTVDDQEIIKHQIVCRIIATLSRFVKPTDTYKSSYVSTSLGSVVFDSIYVDESGAEFTISTDKIEAGGYNIQKLHYRFLAKCPFRKDYSSGLGYSATQILKEKTRKLTKIQKLRKEIDLVEQNIENTTKKYTAASQLSDDEILANDIEMNKDFARYINAEYNPASTITKDEYEIAKNEMIESRIKMFKKFNSEHVYLQRIKTFKNEIAKIEKKIQALES